MTHFTESKGEYAGGQSGSFYQAAWCQEDTIYPPTQTFTTINTPGWTLLWNTCKEEFKISKKQHRRTVSAVPGRVTTADTLRLKLKSTSAWEDLEEEEKMSLSGASSVCMGDLRVTHSQSGSLPLSDLLSKSDPPSEGPALSQRPGRAICATITCSCMNIIYHWFPASHAK